MSASPSVDEHHLKRLLDLRSARTADMYNHRRFPSLSEMSDSPSIYSHAQFSPQPMDRAELQANTAAFNFAIPSQYKRAVSRDPEPRTPRFDRERLNDPSASTLILDDDSISSRANSEIYYDSDHEVDPEEQVQDEEDTGPRMSYLGPKMRFHSPAPWETGEETVIEQDEPDDDARSFISRRGRNWTKGFGLATSKLGGASRPSGESTRSSGKEKKSSDTSSSSQVSAFGALHSIGLSAPNGAQSSSQPQPSSSHVRNRTISNVNSSTQAPHHRQPASRSNTFDMPSSSAMPRSRSPASFMPRPDTRQSSYRSDSPDSHSRQSDYASVYSHPYANPDSSAYNRDSVHPKLDMYRAADTRSIVHAESNTNFQDTNTSVSSPSSRRGSVATVAISPDTSPGSAGNSNGDIAGIKRSVGHIQGKTISSPMPAGGHALRSVASISSIASRSRIDSSLQPPANPLSRWNDLPASPTITLISLEQAQAQAKSRSATATGTPSSSANAFLDSEPPVRVSSRTSGHRARARSTSAGAKAKNALQSLTPAVPSAAPPWEGDAAQEQWNNNASPRPPLKHKRSGFMRLFNGKERERSAPPSPPPPVPPLHDASPAAPVPTRAHKLSVTRVPVPTITPPPPQSFDDHGGNELPAGRMQDSSPSMRGRRQFPPLTILPPNETPGRLTLSPDAVDPSKPDNRSRATLRPEPTQARGGLAPLSAPPGTTEFPSLSLRPVSTIFSAHFDHLVDSNDSEPDSSVATTFSPLSPGFSMRSPGGKGGQEPSIATEESTAIIQALKDQISSSRKIYQTQIWELDSQIRDLHAEVDELRNREGAAGGDFCSACGRGSIPIDGNASSDGSEKRSIVNRPRARTGVGGSRFVSK